MPTTTDGIQSQLKTFQHFCRLLRETHLPGSKDATLLRNVHSLARARIEKEKQSRLAAHVSKDKLRPLIKVYRKVIRASEKASAQIQSAHDIYAKGLNTPLFECETWFAPVKGGILRLIEKLREMEEIAVNQLPKRYRKPGEEVHFTVLFGDHDYDLPRLGWKPSQTWFVDEVVELLEGYVDKKTKGRLDR